MPHFFIYAKKKEKNRVEEKNNSTTNRLEDVIPNPYISFKGAELGKLYYQKLMVTPDVDIESESAKRIIERYNELDLKKFFFPTVNKDGNSVDNVYLYKKIRQELLALNSNAFYVVDVLIKYVYTHKPSNTKTTLWSSFGDVIVGNLKYNIDSELTYCEVCGDLTEVGSNRQKYCERCAIEINREKTKKRMKIIRKREMFDLENTP